MLRRLREAQLGQATLHHPPAGWSSTLVKRLQLERTLEGHDGCVNTVHFSPCGQLLVSGSDDMQIFFWDWHLGTRTLAFHSGHHNNVFQARIMPQSANGTVVTCAADGLVRVAHVPQGTGGASVETRRLACHRGRAHKLALEPGSPHCFLSCGEDGEVRHFDLREPAGANRRLLACRTQRGRLELNSVHCHPGNTQFCVAGGDPFVRVYDLRRLPSSSTPIAEPLRRLAPWHLRGRRNMVTITAAVFAQNGQVLATYNDENIYLFASEGQQHAAQAAAANGVANGSGGGRRVPTAAAATEQQRPQQHERRRNAGGGRGGSKRGRSSSSREARGGDEGSGEDARAQSQQRRATAAAAMAQARSQRATSGAAAAAEAHASFRRMVAEEAEEPAGPGPLPARPAASRPVDAAWLGSLPSPRGGRQRREQQQEVQQEGGQQQQQQQEVQQEGGQQQQQQKVRQEGGQQHAAAPTVTEQTGVLTSSSGSEEEGAGWGSEDQGSPPLWLGDSTVESSGEEEEGVGEEELPDASSPGSDEELLGGQRRSSTDSESADEEEETGEEGLGSEEEEEEEEEFGFTDEDETPQGALVDDEDSVEAGGRGARGGGAGGSASMGQQEQPNDDVLQTYKGHRNYRTVKGVSFLGQHDEFVMSGSDCGHIYVWDTHTGAPQALLKGDHDTVNCLEPHPHHLLTIATSGIEDSIKLWAPTAEEPQVLGAAEERRMAANQRAQGEERRMAVSPEMLRILLRARQLGVNGHRGSSSEEEEEEEGSEEDGEGGGGGRHPGECTVS